MKCWILFSLLFVSSHCVFAQQTTDEEFLAKAVIGDISDADSIFYISPKSWYPYISLSEWESEASQIWEALRELGVPDSNIIQITTTAVKMYEEKQEKRKQNWNKKSESFKSKRHVHFKEKKDKPCLHVSKPIFDANHNYAVIEVREIITKKKFKRYFSLYKKEDAAWKKRGDFARFMKDEEDNNEKKIFLFSNTKEIDK